MKRTLTIFACLLAATTFGDWTVATKNCHWVTKNGIIQAVSHGDAPINVPDLFAHYCMNDSSQDAIVHDTKGNDGILFAGTTADWSGPGKRRGALSSVETDASSYSTQGVTIPAVDGGGLNVPFTISMWANITGWEGYPGGGLTLIGGTGFGFEFQTTTDGYLVATVLGSPDSIQSTSVLPVGDWHLVTITVDSDPDTGACGIFTFYLDGAADPGGPLFYFPATAPAPFNTSIGIGAWPLPAEWGTGLIGGFPGFFDDVRIYHRAITSDEVLKIWNGGLGTEGE